MIYCMIIITTTTMITPHPPPPVIHHHRYHHHHILLLLPLPLGVTYLQTKGRWLAVIMINGNKKIIGTYETAKKAALAYDRAAVKKFNR